MMVYHRGWDSTPIVGHGQTLLRVVLYGCIALVEGSQKHFHEQKYLFDLGATKNGPIFQADLCQ
jgi:hypothetical protein